MYVFRTSLPPPCMLAPKLEAPTVAATPGQESELRRIVQEFAWPRGSDSDLRAIPVPVVARAVLRFAQNGPARDLFTFCQPKKPSVGGCHSALLDRARATEIRMASRLRRVLKCNGTVVRQMRSVARSQWRYQSDRLQKGLALHGSLRRPDWWR